VFAVQWGARPLAGLDKEDSLRKLFIGALLAVVALAAAAVTQGATQHDYEQTFTKTKTKTSTGTTYQSSSTDPENPQGNQPKPSRTITIRLPGGAKIDNDGAAKCGATDEDFAQDGPAACPGGREYLASSSARPAGSRRYVKSVVGDGSAVVTTNNGGTINATVVAFNRRRGLILYINPEGANAIVLRPSIRSGRAYEIITTIPANCVLGTFDTVDQRCEFNNEPSTAGEAILTSLTLNIVARQRGRGRNRHVLIRTPARCPSNGEWEFVVIYGYRDGTSDTKSSTTPCRRG
jgi:hypothetical protein